VLAEPVVLTAFGDQWRGSIEVMQVLTLFAFAISLDIPPGTAYKSLSRIDILLKLGIPRAVLALGAIVIFVDEGIVAVAACQAAVAALFALINLLLASRMLDTGLRRILVSAAPPLIAAAAMGLVVWVISQIITTPALTLLVAVPVGAVGYVATLWLIAPDSIRKLWRMAFPDRARGLPLAAEEELIDPGHHPSRTELFGAEPEVDVEWAQDAGGSESDR
jgi:O-antigen/teichoic acid export membrane protein